MVERFHCQLKASFLPCWEREHWVDHMPFVLLDIRSTLKQDLDGNPTELAYGTILRRPGDIFTDNSAPDTNTHAYIKKYFFLFRQLRPTPPRAESVRTMFVLPDLQNRSHAFVCRDAVKTPLTPLYDGPFSAISRGGKSFTVHLHNRGDVLVAYRLEPTFIAATIAIASAINLHPDSSLLPAVSCKPRLFSFHLHPAG